MKFLAVDDEPHILELLTMMAARLGYPEVSTASSGEAALDLLNSGDVIFDALLLDISMPGMSGIELCALARNIPAYYKTPVIMLTAMTEKVYIDRAFKAGATDYANKPFNLVELGARLRMAEEIVVARRALPSASATSTRRGNEAKNRPAFDLSDEIQIKGFDTLIKSAALGNYLTQLSSAGQSSAQVLAIKIDQIEAIYAQALPEEFLYALTEVADTIHNALKPSGYMMAYSGNGIFLVVLNKPGMEPSVGLETEIQNLLDEKSSEYDSGAPLDIDVSVGNPIRPNASKTQRVWMTFGRATARAESRMLKKKNQPRTVNVRIVR